MKVTIQKEKKKTIISEIYLLHLNRKLSLDYAQFSSSRVKGQKEDGSRKNRPRKDGSDQTNLSSISRLSQLSKNDINAIRRSQVLLRFLLFNYF